MSEPESDPATVPLLFPDPVTEYYLARVDRAAIHEQLKKTPGERLRWLEEKANEMRRAQDSTAREEPPPWPAKKGKIDMGVNPAWFADAKSVPLLFPDPVIEAYLEDVDRGLLRENLKLTIEQRLERFADFMTSIYALRGAACRDKSELWEKYPFNHG